MELTGQEEEEFQKAMCDAFDEPALVQMLRFCLGRDLFDVVERGPKVKVVFDLIALARREGWMDEFVACALKANPGNPRLKAFGEAHAPRALDPTRPRTMVDPVQKTMEDLVVIVRGPAAARVKEVVVRFRDDFTAVRSRIDVLKKYKALHDHLHNLQFRYLRLVADDVARFESARGPDPTALSDTAREALINLERFALELRTEAGAARREAVGLPTTRIEQPWVEDFDAAVGLIDKGINDQDARVLRQASERLAALPRESPRVNSLLTTTAGELPLDRLIAAVEEVAQLLESAPDNQGLAGRTRTGLAALQKLRPRLAGLIEEHYEWQWLDKEFGLAEGTPGRTLGERFQTWPRVKDRLLALCGANAASQWAAEISALAEQYEAAGSAAGDPFRFDRAFNKLRTLQTRRFYELDLELRELSEELVKIGDPLDALLEMTADAHH